jgi:transcription-repair coupling factor (superfamily II helicase)
MSPVLSRFLSSTTWQRLEDVLHPPAQVVVSGLTGAGPALLAAALFTRRPQSVLFVARAEPQQQNVYHDLQTLVDPARLTLLLRDAQSQLRLVNLLRSGQPCLAVTDAATLEAPAISVPSDTVIELDLHPGARIGRDRIIKWLVEAGFENVDLVTESGEFVSRGGIVDVFPEGINYPVRIELFGDAIESLRLFDPLTQRSVKGIEAVRIPAWTFKAQELKGAEGQAPIRSRRVASLLPNELCVIEQAPTAVPALTRISLSEEPAELDFGLEPPGLYLGNFALLRSEVEATRRETAKNQFYIVCADEYQQQRLARVLGDRPCYVIGSLTQGFVAARENYTVLTEREIYGAPVMRDARRKFKGLPVDDLLALHKGDCVVHVNYGIGVFEGIKRLSVDDQEHDFLEIRYADNGKVYVPVENLGMLDRYIGDDDRPPSLDRLGSKSWHLAKTRTAQAVSDYAEELLEIYARRATAPGFAFARDTPWQTELEASFIHEETPDQLSALNDVKRDMETAKPMDRLVCGDVGYGKTEVALRAAFKAVMDAKQVAVLAPTTILAYQHYNTFKARTAQFPLRIAMVSRFVPPGERAIVLKEIAEGKIDIAIGTHMLLSDKAKFKDLGLLIIDEEQKFGVRQKERFKSLKAAVDQLVLSATPIPRTLYMSLVGLRDVSTIHTPPAGRREILTEVQPWNEALIRHYIVREVSRAGQVFFIHNRIESLDSIHTKLRRLCPELRIAMAHGRMAERALASVYLRFASGEYDVLVSTAIIESGLDLPRVNTIIVSRADWFGLADLHQLRGRVGRTQEQAYALFLIPDQHEVGLESRKRLSSILAYSQLGSGFKLAMRDMEIRGVGNLLGVEQHGHVARVGFSLYVHLLKEAVAKLKGGEVIPEPELSIDVEAFIPESYITGAYERVAIYKRLLSVESETELAGLRDELLDRFGRHPGIVEDLFKVALVRVLARQARLLRVSLKRNRISLISARGERALEGGLDRLLQVLRIPGVHHQDTKEPRNHER